MGKCGCGKTYFLNEVYKKDPNNSIVFCFTHNAVNILRNKYKIENCFTFHSYFKMNYNNVIKKLPVIKENNIFVDEFGMVDWSILKYVFKYKSTHNIILCGDICQLSSFSKKVNTNFNYDFYFDTFNLKPNEVCKIYLKLINSIYLKSFYKPANKILLKHNYRNDEKIFSIMDKALDNKIELINFSDLKREILKKNYVVLSSRYKHLKYINELVNGKIDKDYINTRIGRCYSNQKFIVSENINKKLLNGTIIDDVKKMKFNVDDKNNILPLNFVTFHKSQGNEYDKAIIILDDLFDFSMLYTAIGRCKEKCKFYIIGNKDKVMEEIKSNNRCFKAFEKIIYG